MDGLMLCWFKVCKILLFRYTNGKDANLYCICCFKSKTLNVLSDSSKITVFLTFKLLCASTTNISIAKVCTPYFILFLYNFNS